MIDEREITILYNEVVRLRNSLCEITQIFNEHWLQYMRENREILKRICKLEQNEETK